MANSVVFILKGCLRLMETCVTRDKFIWPTVNEAYEITFLKASISGLPVVTANTGKVSEIVKVDHAGILIQPSSNIAFTDAIVDLINNTVKRNHMSIYYGENI